jgi:hypothetical protein
METVLIIAVVVIALAIVAQAIALVAMYLMSQKISGKAETLMTESQKLMPPLQSVTANLKTATDHAAETARLARQQVAHVGDSVSDLHHSARGNMSDIHDAVLDTVDEAREIVMPALRRYAAIALAISEGTSVFFSRRRRSRETIETEVRREEKREFPAA